MNRDLGTPSNEPSIPAIIRAKSINELFISLQIPGVEPGMSGQEMYELNLWEIPSDEDGLLYKARKILINSTGKTLQDVPDIVDELDSIGLWKDDFVFERQAIYDLRKLLVSPEDRQEALARYYQSKDYAAMPKPSAYTLLRVNLQNSYPKIHSYVIQIIRNMSNELTENENIFDYIINEVKSSLNESDVEMLDIISIVDDLQNRKKEKLRLLSKEFLDPYDRKQIANNRISVSANLAITNYEAEISRLKNKYSSEETGNLYTIGEYAQQTGREKIVYKGIQVILNAIARRQSEIQSADSGVKINEGVKNLFFTKDGKAKDLPLVVNLDESEFVKNTTEFLTDNLLELEEFLQAETEESRLEDGYITFASAIDKVVESLDEESQRLLQTITGEQFRNGMQYIHRIYKSNESNIVGKVQIGLGQILTFGNKTEVLKIAESFVSGLLQVINLQNDGMHFPSSKLIEMEDILVNFKAKFQSWMSENNKRSIKPVGSSIGYYKIDDLENYLRSVGKDEQTIQQLVLKLRNIEM